MNQQKTIVVNSEGLLLDTGHLNILIQGSLHSHLDAGFYLWQITWSV